MPHTAQCQCGQVTITCQGDPVRVSVCHCLACQRRSGSAFAAQVRFPRDRVRMTGTTKDYVRTADSGNRVHQQFCPECGTGTSYYMADTPDVVAVPMGLFDAPYFATPAFSVYEKRRHPWLAITAEGIAHSD